MIQNIIKFYQKVLFTYKNDTGKLRLGLQVDPDLDEKILEFL